MSNPLLDEMTKDNMVCEILQTMRNYDKVKNYSSMASLIEEVQDYVNRMENGLSNSRATAFDVFDFLKNNQVPEAINALVQRWPRLKERN